MIKNDHKVSLDICIIAKNEEDNLRKTLPYSLAGADNVIVVDTGSTDSTKKVADDLGAKVFDFEWIGDFAAARNFALKQSKAQWIMRLDADEHMPAEDSDRLRRFLDITQCSLINLPVLECFYGQSDPKNIWFRQSVFRNLEGVHFERAVNERIVFPDGINVEECGLNDVRVIHWSLGLPDEKLKYKNISRLKLLEDAVKNNPGDPFYVYLLAQRHMRFLKPPDMTKAEANFTHLIDMIDSGDQKWKYLKHAGYAERGHLFLSKQEYDLAEMDANAALDMDDSFIEPYIILATIYLVRKDNDNALTILKKACSLKKKQHPVIGENEFFWNVVRNSFYASCLFEAKRYEEALVYYQLVIDAGYNVEKTKSTVATIKSALRQKDH